jgi:hypothetical protein
MADIIIIWERADSGFMAHPPPQPACLFLQRLPGGVCQLVLPPLARNSRLIGVLWLPSEEFVRLAAAYMDDFIERRMG